MLNVVTLLGRLTADPELKMTTNGTAVTTFTLAVNRNFVGQNGERQADFIDIVAWRTTAEFVTKYFKKGPDDGTTRQLTDPAPMRTSRAPNAK